MYKHAEKKHCRHHHHNGDERVEPDDSGDCPRTVHGYHQKLAMREVDDAQHAEDERQAHAHERINAADEKSGIDELPERDHASTPVRANRLRAAPSPATMSDCVP